MAEFVAHVALGESQTSVGQLRFTHAGPRQFSTFAYGAEWIEDPRAFAIQPDFPLEAGPFHTSRQPGHMRDALAGAFAGAAPDSWGRRLLERAYGNGLNEFEYLTLSDDTCRQGALRFLDDHGEVIRGKAADAIPRLVDLETITAIARAYEQGKEISPEEMQALAGAGGSGGARPKANVRDGDVLWLAKFTSVDDQQPIERVEVATLRLAEACGRHAVSSCSDPAVRPTQGRTNSLHLRAHRARQDRGGAGFLYRDRRFHALLFPRSFSRFPRTLPASALHDPRVQQGRSPEKPRLPLCRGRSVALVAGIRREPDAGSQPAWAEDVKAPWSCEFTSRHSQLRVEICHTELSLMERMQSVLRRGRYILSS